MSFTLKVENWKAFFNAPFNVYEGKLPFISQMDSELKGLFSKKLNPMRASGALDLTYFTVHDALDKPVGRIAAHYHEGSQKHFPDKTAFFGYFDCMDSPEAAALLMAEAEKWARSRGCKRIIGNFNLLATQMMGVLEEGFERAPYLAMNYGGPQIPGLLQGLSFRRRFPMTTYEVDLAQVTDEDLRDERERENLSSQNFLWKKAKKRQLPKLLEEIRVVMNDAFEKNAFFSPLTAEEFWHQAKDLSFILDPEITAVVYSPDGRLAGAIVVIPDANVLMAALRSRLGIKALWEIPKFKLKPGRALVLFAAVRKDMHSKGLGWTLTCQIFKQMKARGYKSVGVTWVSDENTASQALVKKVRGRPYHRLALYEKVLAP